MSRWLGQDHDSTFRRRWVMPLTGGFLLVAVLILGLYHPTPAPEVEAAPPAEAQPPVTESRTEAAQEEAAAPNSEPAPGDKKEEDLTPVERFVLVESAKIGRATPDPDGAFRKLKSIAHNLKRQDFAALNKTALNGAYTNDRRFLSVYLLSLADDPHVVSALMGVALNPLPSDDPSSRLYAEEIMIRTQALEGLARFHGPGRWVLNDYLASQDNAFLAQQARRLLQERRAGRKGH